MSEDTDRRQESPGRVLHVTACGDTADEIEMAALDQARELFGPDRRLEVVPAYHVSPIGGHHPPAITQSGKRYTAPITIRVIESGPS